MSVDLCCKFKEPLTAAEIGHWAGVTLTDDELKQILEDVRAYQNERDYDKQAMAWDKCHETEISSFVFSRFFDPDNLALVELGRRWWVQSMLCVYPGELDEDRWLPYTDAISESYTKLFVALPRIKKHLGEGFPYLKMEYLYWG